MKRFLFLELLDPEIHALINGLRHEFGQKKSTSNLHITVRGPYKNSIPKKSVENFSRILSGDAILIHSAGLFVNDGVYVVYVKINSENLKKIWWKPDYPVKQYGFNPHISLYIGRDKYLANEIHEFLRREKLKVLCREFKLTEYVTKQGRIFADVDIPKEKHFLELSNRRLVRADILQRAANLVNNYQKKLEREGP